MEWGLVSFLTRRPDEASQVLKYLSLPEVSALQGVCRPLRTWARSGMRSMLGGGGRVSCGTNNLTLDLVTMRFDGGLDAHDRGDVFYTGCRTRNRNGQLARVLVRSQARRYTLCWDVFADASRSQRLWAHTMLPSVMRPLVLPRVENARTGIMVVSPCGTGHDFVAYADLARLVTRGKPGSELRVYDFFPVLHRTRESRAWDSHARVCGLYESAAYAPSLNGVVYGLQGVLCFIRYDCQIGFHGDVVALPLKHSLGDIVLVPAASTYAYDPHGGVLYVVGGKLSTGRKSGAVYSFPLRRYLTEVAAARPNSNTRMSAYGVCPVWLDSRSKLKGPDFAYLFRRVGTLRHPRAWCHVRFAHQGKVILVWGGKGKFDKHPSALELFLLQGKPPRWRQMQTPLACPDNVVW